MRQKELQELKAWRLALADAGDQHNALLLGCAIESILRSNVQRGMVVHLLNAWKSDGQIRHMPVIVVKEVIDILEGNPLR